MKPTTSSNLPRVGSRIMGLFFSSEETLSLDEKYSPSAHKLMVDAQILAKKMQHLQVYNMHLLLAATNDYFDVIQEILNNSIVVSKSEFKNRIEQTLSALETDDEEEPYLSREFKACMKRAETFASDNSKVSVHNIITSLFSWKNTEVADLIQDVMNSGSQTSKNEVEASNDANTAASSIMKKNSYLRDLTATAKSGKIDPIIGRVDEVARIFQILERKNKNNPILVGDPGVGKTAIVEEIARRIARKEAPASLHNKTILSIDLGLLATQSKSRNDLEDKLKELIKSVESKASNVILFVDEFHTILNKGGSNYPITIIPALARTELRCIAISSAEDFKKNLQTDNFIARRFQPITIAEPSVQETISILRGTKEKYEQYHKVKIDDSAITTAVNLSNRYISDKKLPDKAIDILDEASAKIKHTHSHAVVNDQSVAEFVSSITGIKLSKMVESENVRLARMEDELGKRVVGQNHVIHTVSKAIRRARLGLKDANKPIGSFLFLGPSGVGKTELAKALAEFMFDDEQCMTRFDMSEFLEAHMAQRLIGAPPGYVDSENGGLLTEAVKNKPFSVLLFDEIEKANTRVFDLLLQVLDDGRLTDGRGKLVDFSNTIIIMTSNIGSKQILEADESEDINKIVRKELAAVLRPEFINRFDDIITFNALTKRDLRNVVDIQLNKLNKMLLDRKIKIQVSEDARDQLVNLSNERAFGARPVKRAITKNIQDPLTEHIISGNNLSDGTIKIGFSGDTFTFTQG